VAIATSGSVNTSIRGLRQSQHPLIWSLTLDASCISNRQTPGTMHVEQMAVMSASDFEMVSYVSRHVAKAFTSTLHEKIIDKYWNTVMQEINIWSIAFGACTKVILKEVC
jgi:hypothetical protein